jgi:hypothetical protein
MVVKRVDATSFVTWDSNGGADDEGRIREEG